MPRAGIQRFNHTDRNAAHTNRKGRDNLRIARQRNAHVGTDKRNRTSRARFNIALFQIICRQKARPILDAMSSFSINIEFLNCTLDTHVQFFNLN
jgi:hypothetical protein